MAESMIRAGVLAGAAAWCVPLIASSQTTESLSISGVPPTSVQAGHTYTFTPDAVASGPLSPELEIQNRPSWASFSWTGELTGTPTATDVGTYSDIIISIVAGTDHASLPSFSITVQAAGGTEPATISWTPPTTNANGSVLTNLAGYRIYVGSAPNQLTPVLTLDNAGLTKYVLEGLSPGLHYFAMTAVNSLGVESKLSAIVAATL